MSKLETFQSVGENTTKEFDKMNDKEKQEGFKNLIKEIEKNKGVKRLKDKRNLMTEKQKLKLYKKNAITISGILERGTTSTPPIAMTNHIKNMVINRKKNPGTYSFLEQIPCRFLVQLGILDKPEGLSEDKLIEDVKKDAKNFNTLLWITKTICMCIPETEPIVPFLGIAKHYTKWYKDHGTEIIISRLHEKKEETIREQTNQELADTKKDNEKLAKKAA